MEEAICKGVRCDYDDIIDFGSLVFRLDFKALLPKLYDSHPEQAEYHHLAKEDGKIKAMVGNFPLTLQVAGKPLKVYGIGTVSVHPYCRGKGYMKTLMQNAVEEARQNGGDLMVLSGLRQRYEYFGFTKCGIRLEFHYNQRNKLHLKQYSTEGISLVSLVENEEWVNPCLELYKKQRVFAGRTAENFVEVASSWNAIPFAILLNGAFVGYCSFVSESKSVDEIFLSDPSLTVPAIFKLLELVENNLSVSLQPNQVDCIREAYRSCEYSQITNGGALNVLNYPKVIEAFLTLKGQSEELIDGSFVIDVQNVGRYKITVQKGIVSVDKTDEDSDLSCGHLEMMSRLFDSMSRYFQGKQASAVEKSWFPIPVYFPHMDNV